MEINESYYIMKILLTGVSGLLGINFAITAAAQHEVLGICHKQVIHSDVFKTTTLDLFDENALSDLITTWRPDCIVHCAALADVDRCEEQPELAHQINVQLTEHIAKIAAIFGVKLLFISTDAVFNGERQLYTELDSTHPINVYGTTKVKAEELVLKYCENAIIARVNFYGWSVTGTRSLAEWVINNLRKNITINGFTDICFCPLLANSLATILLKMLAAELSGIYHVVSSQKITKYEFAVNLAKQFSLDETLIVPSSVHHANTKAKRPQNIVLNNRKLISALGNIIPATHDDIRIFHQMETSLTVEHIRSMLAITEKTL
jgi:dTDP-4-dehydrorhamnose reductase